MKKFLLLLFVAAIAACSKSNDEPQQDYTSFVITQQADVNLTNIVSGYFDKRGYCWKIANHGDLSLNQSTSETVLTIDVDSIYIFTDYNDGRRLSTPLIIKKNCKNILELTSESRGVRFSSKLDSLQYPQ